MCFGHSVKRRPSLLLISGIVLVVFIVNAARHLKSGSGVDLWFSQRYAYENLPVLGLRVDVSSTHNISVDTTVAIGCAITTRGLSTDASREAGIDQDQSHQLTSSMPFFKHLLPSFCKTASAGFHYRFYIAYDADDPLLTGAVFRDAFVASFNRSRRDCVEQRSGLRFDIKVFQSKHTKAPASAQNDAMMEAYRDQRPRMEYYYRVNDDTFLVTARWTEIFVRVLRQYDPPLVGVVGPAVATPADHRGNPSILAYDFVHRTHLDIFGYYYPAALTTWYADDWITHVYQPRTIRALDVVVLHTMSQGRYESGKLDSEVLEDLILSGRSAISAWTDR